MSLYREITLQALLGLLAISGLLIKEAFSLKNLKNFSPQTADLQASETALLGGAGFPLKAGLGAAGGIGKFGAGGLHKGGFGKGAFGGHGVHGAGYGGTGGFGKKGIAKGFGAGGFGAGGGFHNAHGTKGAYGGHFLGGHTKAFAHEKSFGFDTGFAKGAHGGFGLGFGAKGAHAGKAGYGGFGKLGAFGNGGYGHHKGGTYGAVGKGGYGAHGHGLGNYGKFGLLGKGAGGGLKAFAPHKGIGFLGR